jgi:hypothetical protein
MVAERLDRDIGCTPQEAGAQRERDPLPVPVAAGRRSGQSERRRYAGVHRERRGVIGAVSAVATPVERGRQEREPRGRQGDADPFPPGHLEAEETIGHDRQEDEPARNDRLHE